MTLQIIIKMEHNIHLIYLEYFNRTSCVWINLKTFTIWRVIALNNSISPHHKHNNSGLVDEGSSTSGSTTKEVADYNASR